MCGGAQRPAPWTGVHHIGFRMSGGRLLAAPLGRRPSLPILGDTGIQRRLLRSLDEVLLACHHAQLLRVRESSASRNADRC